MGRYSVMSEAPGCLGTSVRMVALAVAGKNEEVKKSWTDCVTSPPSKSQVALKNPDVRPSGPGALLGFRLNIVRLISSAKGTWIMVDTSSVGHE